MISQWTAFPDIERYAKFDFDEIAAELDKRYALDPNLINISIDEDFDEDETVYTITGIFQIDDLQVPVTYHAYDLGDELEYDEIGVKDLYNAYKARYYESMNMHSDAEYYKSKIRAATSIMAADEDDPFSDMDFNDEDDFEEPVESDPSVEESLDDMNDVLDEINDSLQDFDEDPTDIELENNIDKHLIAECEKCHGVFITAIEESDEVIEKISGDCPLCDENCDQYIKWVINAL